MSLYTLVGLYSNTTFNVLFYIHPGTSNFGLADANYQYDILQTLLHSSYYLLAVRRLELDGSDKLNKYDYNNLQYTKVDDNEP